MVEGEQRSLHDQLRMLPDRPGVYLFRDAPGQILYVGKAVSLKNRVRSYFQAGRGLEAKTQALVALVASLEIMVTDSEVEALILENNLIKRHHPKYNIRLRDDKQYPFLRLDMRAAWPRLEVVRRPQDDGARYFGPYPHASAVRETMDVLRRAFPYRTCSDRRLAQPQPCLYHHIHRCLAPCIAATSAEEYRRMIGDLEQFLDGRGEGVLSRLRERMHEAAEDLRFEEAAQLRDRLAALDAVLAKQKVHLESREDRDVLAVARGEDEAAVEVFHFREGKLAGHDGFVLMGTEGADDGQVLESFIGQFYGEGMPVPRELLLSGEVPNPEIVRAMLRTRRGGAVALAVPRRGPKREQVEMVRRNAAEHLGAEQWRRERSQQAIAQALEELAGALRLAAPPQRIECYDNSNLQGTNAVSAMVVFTSGRPDKSQYRKFRVRTVQGADDFATMREVLGRRFARAQAERAALASQNADGAVPAGAEGFAHLPDLVIIDGGRGQLSSARTAMRELGLGGIPTFGLAKEQEWIYCEGSPEPIVLPRESPALHLLQRVRDEAHRFGLGYHRNLRGRASVRSLLEEAPHIGPKRRKALLSAYPSLAAIREAGAEALARVPGMNRQAAEDLLAYLASSEATAPERHDA